MFLKCDHCKKEYNRLPVAVRYAGHYRHGSDLSTFLRFFKTKEDALLNGVVDYFFQEPDGLSLCAACLCVLAKSEHEKQQEDCDDIQEKAC